MTPPTITSPTLLVPDQLSQTARIDLLLDRGAARTEDGAYQLDRSGGSRKRGLPPYWYLYRYSADRREREPVQRIAAWRREDAMRLANAWLAAQAIGVQP